MWAVILYNMTVVTFSMRIFAFKRRIATLESRYIPREWDFSKVRAKAPTLLESPMGLG